MAPQTPSGTIVGPTGDASFGGTVQFRITATGLKGNQWPMVLCNAYATKDYAAADLPTDHSCSGNSQAADGIAEGDLIYGELVKPTANGVATFLLGGGSSLWYCIPGEPAHCEAILYAYSKQGEIVQLADAVEFEAS